MCQHNVHGWLNTVTMRGTLDTAPLVAGAQFSDRITSSLFHLAINYL